jgi:hypothetical protein
LASALACLSREPGANPIGPALSCAPATAAAPSHAASNPAAPVIGVGRMEVAPPAI